jgi:hypothetical protein
VAVAGTGAWLVVDVLGCAAADGAFGRTALSVLRSGAVTIDTGLPLALTSAVKRYGDLPADNGETRVIVKVT